MFIDFNESNSKTHILTCGIPQESFLGLYTLPLGNVIRRRGRDFHSNADDTQLYMTMSPDDLDLCEKK